MWCQRPGLLICTCSYVSWGNESRSRARFHRGIPFNFDAPFVFSFVPPFDFFFFRRDPGEPGERGRGERGRGERGRGERGRGERGRGVILSVLSNMSCIRMFPRKSPSGSSRIKRVILSTMRSSDLSFHDTKTIKKLD